MIHIPAYAKEKKRARQVKRISKNLHNRPNAWRRRVPQVGGWLVNPFLFAEREAETGRREKCAEEGGGGGGGGGACTVFIFSAQFRIQILQGTREVVGAFAIFFGREGECEGGEPRPSRMTRRGKTAGRPWALPPLRFRDLRERAKQMFAPAPTPTDAPATEAKIKEKARKVRRGHRNFSYLS